MNPKCDNFKIFNIGMYFTKSCRILFKHNDYETRIQRSNQTALLKWEWEGLFCVYKVTVHIFKIKIKLLFKKIQRNTQKADFENIGLTFGDK
jgi:hypothetical protein